MSDPLEDIWKMEIKAAKMKERIAELEAEVGRFREEHSVLFDGYSVLKEVERLNPGMKFNSAFPAHISRMLDAVVSLQKRALLQEDKP